LRSPVGGCARHGIGVLELEAGVGLVAHVVEQVVQGQEYLPGRLAGVGADPGDELVLEVLEAVTFPGLVGQADDEVLGGADDV
jgi:hypothetical protein